MTGWQIAVTTVLYIWVAIDLLIAGRTGMSLSFLGYAIGNAGLMWAAHQ